MKSIARSSLTGLVCALLLVALAAFFIANQLGYGSRSIAYTALTEFGYPLACPMEEDSDTGAASAMFTDASDWLESARTPRTFSLTAADFSGDGWDDLLIGAHNGRPQLLLSSGGRFRDASHLIANKRAQADWHAHTAVDIDNDGRLDLAIAGGGSDGIGNGTGNAFFRNTSTAGARTDFRRVAGNETLASPRTRTRALLPVASDDGTRVDLYSTALPREGFPNRYMANTDAGAEFALNANPYHPLNGSYIDHGRGSFADFDGDGQRDYLVVNDTKAEIHWAKNRSPSLLATDAFATAVGDVNNDGLPDVYVGRTSPQTRSDRISFGDEGINFVIHQNRRVDPSTLSFESELASLRFDLRQHFPRGQRGYPAGGKDIFLGRNRAHPASRSFALHKDDAIGKPDNFRKSGIYIWYSDSNKRWHVRWQFQNYASIFKGAISGSRISRVETSGLTRHAPEPIYDALLLNQGNGKFSSVCAGVFGHRLTTSGVTIADVDNNGWIDVVGVRHAEQGGDDGEIFMLFNDGMTWTRSQYSRRPQDEMVRSDLVVHGFFNRDNNPDLAITYGFGQLPGTGGRPRLLLNQNPGGHKALVIDLQGRTANSFAIGAQLRLYSAGKQLLGTRIAGVNTNLSQDTHLLHFGLGMTAPPYTLQVLWPDQRESRHTLNKPGYHKVRQPKAN